MILFDYSHNERRVYPHRFRTRDWRFLGPNLDPKMEEIHAWVEGNATGPWEYRVRRSERLGIRVLFHASFRFEYEIDALAFKMRWL